MTPRLLPYLCDPMDGSGVSIQEGMLVSKARKFPILDGVPRFARDSASVESFGDEWNTFDFVEFKRNWLEHTVANTFGSVDVFRGKVIVDAGAGSGAQSKWVAEAGALHVIALELSHSVDGVIQKNVGTLQNVDVIQCSIDEPPIKPASIDMVICHNVIQHTRSVEATAEALWRLVKPGGEFVFNCYPKNDRGLLRKARFSLHMALRQFLSQQSFRVRMRYAKACGVLRVVPGLGFLLEKAGLVVCGLVPLGSDRIRRTYRQTVLNTFDAFGAHLYQHHKTDEEVRTLIRKLRPARVLNEDAYFSRPPPIGIALRLVKP